MVRTRFGDESTSSSSVGASAGLISPVVDFALLFVVVFAAALVMAHMV